MKTQLPAVHGTVLGGDKLFKSELLKLCTRLGLMHTVQYSTVQSTDLKVILVR